MKGRVAGAIAGLWLMAIGALALAVWAAVPSPGAGAASPPAPIRAAFYDSRFPADWTRAGGALAAHDSPSVGLYDTRSDAVVRRQISAMAYGGISVGVVGWDGPGTVSDRRLPVLLAAARGGPFRWAIEVRATAASRSAASVAATLRYIRRRYGGDPGYLRLGGRFVLFVAHPGPACAGSARWVSARPRAYLMLAGGAADRRCGRQPAGWYRNAAGVPEARMLPDSLTISPGLFPGLLSRPRVARDLARWGRNVRDLAASGARFQLIASFNDWPRGSAVESARQWQSASGFGAYLDVLHANGAPAIDTPSVAPLPTSVPAPVTPPPPPPAPPPAPPVVVPPPPPPPPPAPDPVVVAAGDIACDPADPLFHAGLGDGVDCLMRATSDLALAAHPAAVLTLGDTQYENNTYPAFLASFDPTWGRFKALIHPAAGNHEYQTAKAAGYFQYFGAAAGLPTEGYYSYDVGAWHLIVLNSNCAKVGGCAVGSPQEAWLRADLKAHTGLCTLAYWHQPRFSSGEFGNEAPYDPFWRDLYAAGAEIVLGAHDHDYERFAPQTPDELPDPTRGIREFIVGTGGKNHRQIRVVVPNSEVREANTFGLLELTLHPTGYDWRFVPVPGGTFTDAGTGTCHGPNGTL